MSRRSSGCVEDEFAYRETARVARGNTRTERVPKEGNVIKGKCQYERMYKIGVFFNCPRMWRCFALTKTRQINRIYGVLILQRGQHALPRRRTLCPSVKENERFAVSCVQIRARESVYDYGLFLYCRNHPCTISPPLILD